MRSPALTVALLLGMTGASCGSGAHDAVRPEQPTAAGGMNRGTLKAVDGPSSPLVVDWKAEQRADLEEVVHDGVAVVAWDDAGLRLLKRCKLDGNYGYLPVTVKKDVVRLETADDVQANLPLGGLGIVGKIGGGFSQGTTLDVALAMVGKRRTTWNDVSRDDLVGECTGATHYVRAILVGAFAMKTGTKSQATGAAQIFGAGASGDSSSSKDVSSTDGKLDACEAVTGEETKPPPQCAAILRLELEPIAKEAQHPATAQPAAAKASPQVTSEIVEGCPEGFVFSSGACKRGGADLPHVCSPNDAADCEAQCGKGDGASCDRLGTLIADPQRAQGAFEKACSAGYANGCANLGVRLLFGANRDPKAAALALAKGCALGNGRACEVGGEMFLEGRGDTKDARMALKFFAKGCEGGEFASCTNAGFLFTGGGGPDVPRDDQKSLEYAKRACFGGESTACGNAGYKIELGESVAPDPRAALAFYSRGCKLNASICYRNGFLLMTGASGVPKDEDAAKALLGKACAAQSGVAAIACVVGSSFYGLPGSASRAGLDHTASIMKPQCDTKEGRACSFLGIAEFGLDKKTDAAEHLKAACGFKDPLGCELAKRLR